MPSILAEKKPTASSSRAIVDQSIGDAGKSMPAIPALQRKDTSGGTLQLKAIQLKGDEEELLVQGKFTIQQKGGPEEEEPLQMKAFQLKSDTIQKEGAPEEEDLLQKKPFQLKNDTVQKAGPLEEEEPLQKKPFQLKSDTIQKAAAPEEELPVQGKLDPIQKKANNTGLPDNLKSGVEQLSGFAMDDVKVHYNSSQPAQLNALAYAQGTDIHVAPGQEKHLPHEAWHVAQQKQGRVQPTMQMKAGVPVNDDPGLENEADVMGAKAIQTAQAPQNVIQQKKIMQMRSLSKVVTQRMSFPDLLAIKTTNTGDFVRTIFGSSFGIGVWKFPKQADGDGIMGKNCISASYTVSVTGTDKVLALHLNFMVVPGSMTAPTTVNDFTNLTLSLSLLHMTARTANNQGGIVANGPSILTAGNSIHCGPGNDWDWTKPNVTNLQNEMGCSLVNLQTALAGYGQAYVAGIRDSIRAEIIRAARNREATATLLGDATWS